MSAGSLEARKLADQIWQLWDRDGPSLWLETVKRIDAALRAKAEASAQDLLPLLRRATAAVYELHAQGIGCPDCDSREAEEPYDGAAVSVLGKPSCGLVRDLDAALGYP
jgi:hypothetical protein